MDSFLCFEVIILPSIWLVPSISISSTWLLNIPLIDWYPLCGVQTLRGWELLISMLSFRESAWWIVSTLSIYWLMNYWWFSLLVLYFSLVICYLNIRKKNQKNPVCFSFFIHDLISFKFSKYVTWNPSSVFELFLCLWQVACLCFLGTFAFLLR